MIQLHPPISLLKIGMTCLLDDRCLRIRASSIDKPRGGIYLCKNVMKIQGWVLGLASSAVAIDLNLNGQNLRRKRLTIIRPDVYAAYPQAKEQDPCGFRLQFPLKALPRAFRIDIIVLFEDGNREAFAFIKGEHAPLGNETLHQSPAKLIREAQKLEKLLRSLDPLV